MAKQKVKGIRSRGNTFMVDVTVDGKRSTKGGFKSYDDALAYHQQLSNAKVNGADVDAVARSVAKGTRTLKDALEKTYQLYWNGIRSEKTAMHNADDVLKHFGDNKKLSEITDDAIVGYKQSVLATGNSLNTWDRKLSALSKMLSTAHEQGWIAKKLAFKNHYSKLSKQEITRNCFITDDEEREFLQRCAVHAHKDPKGKWAMFTDFVQYLIDTGVRTYKEGLSLQTLPSNSQTCIQWHNNTIFVPPAVSKTGRGRSIPMTPRLKGILQKWSAIAKSKNKTKVFYGLTKDSVAHYWNTIRAEMGWQGNKNYCPYICRHTCASRLVMGGASLPLVMEWMGHTQWSTTLGYAHLAPSTLNSLAVILDKKPQVVDANVEVEGVEASAKIAGASK